ncbi:MAG: cation diffusion facilitator family transporter [Candidatus Nanopelagicales bacterium]|nr:cation diffusion facilitator family transporter [Candidatus Nanopelagicales bacterium]
MHGQEDLSRYAWLSIATGVVVFSLKMVAYAMTASVGLLSDALESTVNIVAAFVALIALKAAARPGDQRHHFGLSKAEYFSALVEGLMILVAAGLIIVTAVERLLNPRPLEDVGVGLAISVVASLINGVVAWILMRAGRRHRSIVLQADAKHLMTDVWTSAGVIVAVGAVALTGWLQLDPVIAIAVAINIVVAGLRLIGSSAMGLLDAALPDEENEVIVEILRKHQTEHVRFHALQTRESGRQRFVSMHVLVPGMWTVAAGHDLLEAVEHEIAEALPNTVVSTHLEPIEDPRAWEDQPPGGVTVPVEETWNDS